VRFRCLIVALLMDEERKLFEAAREDVLLLSSKATE
jgi:hypothetical protein